MKKLIALTLALVMLCLPLCACQEKFDYTRLDGKWEREAEWMDGFGNVSNYYVFSECGEPGGNIEFHVLSNGVEFRLLYGIYNFSEDKENTIDAYFHAEKRYGERVPLDSPVTHEIQYSEVDGELILEWNSYRFEKN